MGNHYIVIKHWKCPFLAMDGTSKHPFSLQKQIIGTSTSLSTKTLMQLDEFELVWRVTQPSSCGFRVAVLLSVKQYRKTSSGDPKRSRPYK